MHMLFQSTSIGVNLCTYSTLGMYKSTEAQKLFLLRSASLVITAEKEKYKVINKQTDSVAQKSHQPLVFTFQHLTVYKESPPHVKVHSINAGTQQIFKSVKCKFM